MKSIILSGLLAVGLLVPTTGCKFWSTNKGTYIDYIRPATSLTVLTVLDNAVDEEERVERAILIYHSSVIIEALSSGAVPEANAVRAALEEYLPEGAIWADFIASLDDIYKTAYSRTNEDAQLVLEVVTELAAGCKEGAVRYLNEHSVPVPGTVDGD